MAVSMYDKLYGKCEAPRRRRKKEEREKDMNEKKVEREEEKPQSYISRYDGKSVEVKLGTRDTLRGIFHTTGFNKFDVVLDTSDGSYLIPKHAIIWVVEKGEKKE